MIGGTLPRNHGLRQKREVGYGLQLSSVLAGIYWEELCVLSSFQLRCPYPPETPECQWIQAAHVWPPTEGQASQALGDAELCRQSSMAVGPRSVCVLLPFHFHFSPRTASLGLCLGNSDQALTAGFPKLSKHLISSRPGIKLREERISVVNTMPDTLQPGSLVMEGLAAQLREWASQQMASAASSLRCRQPPLSRSCPSQSISCWRLRSEYQGSAISQNQSPWVSDACSTALSGSHPSLLPLGPVLLSHP